LIKTPIKRIGLSKIINTLLEKEKKPEIIADFDPNSHKSEHILDNPSI